MKTETRPRAVRVPPLPEGGVADEKTRVVRFDLSPESPYFRPNGGWQKGRYQIFLRGNEQTNQPALTDQADQALDGEAKAPAGGVMSGDGTAGGDFSTFFIVGDDAAPRETLRVVSVEFLNRINAVDRSITQVKSPLKATGMTTRDGLNLIRVKFNQPFAQDIHVPTTHGPNDPDFRRHNVQVLRTDDGANAQPYVPGVLQIEAPDPIDFILNTTAPPVREPSLWPAGSFRLFLRGVDDVPRNRPAIFDLIARALDGEPIAPANSVISGDGTAGGDFTAEFIVKG